MATFGQGIGIGIGLDLSLQAGNRTDGDVEPLIRIIFPSRQYVLTGYEVAITTPEPEARSSWLWEDGDNMTFENGDRILEEELV